MKEVYREKRGPIGNIRSVYDCGVQSTLGRAEVASLHVHEYFEILYCQQGAYRLMIGGKSFRLNPGDMALIDPMEIHGSDSLHEGMNQYLVIKFLPEVLYSAERLVFELKYILPYLKGSAPHPKVVPAALAGPAGLFDMLNEIVDEYIHQDFGYELALRANISRLFLWVLRRWHAHKPDSALDASTLNTLARAFAFVDEQYDRDISMSDAALACGMDYLSFSRFFSRHSGRGFAEHLLHTRLKNAALMLCATDDSITEVAMKAGFSATSYFIKRFKAAHGMTPRQFRLRYSANGEGE